MSTTTFGWLQLPSAFRANAMVVEISPREWADHQGWDKAETFRALVRAKEKVHVSGWLTWDQEHAAHLGKYRKNLVGGPPDPPDSSKARKSVGANVSFYGADQKFPSFLPRVIVKQLCGLSNHNLIFPVTGVGTQR
jgi:hypothetical protein